MVLSPAFAELGWTGGGSSTGEACSVNELTFAKPAVAAGKEEIVFMLSRNAKTPKIVESVPAADSARKAPRRRRPRRPAASNSNVPEG